MISKPTFIFIPGAWHSPECFDEVRSILEKQGYGYRYIHLATSRSDPTPTSFDPDVELIRNATEEALASGKDVVLVMHSYGGVPGSEAMKYFINSNEGAQGRGRILRMAFVSAFALPKEGSLMKALGGENLPWFRVTGPEVRPADPDKIFYNDLPAAEASKWIAKLKPHAYGSFSTELTVEPWRTIPSAYLLCEADNAIPLPVQRGIVETVQKIAPKSFDIVDSCSASHSPFLSQPEVVASFLEKVSRS